MTIVKTPHLTFDEILNNVESLTIEDRDLLFEIIQKRRTETRRELIAKNAQETIKSFQNGAASKGSLDSLKADLQKTD